MAENISLIGRILQKYNLVTNQQWTDVVDAYGERGQRRIGELLQDKGLLTAEQVIWLDQAVNHYELRSQKGRAPRQRGLVREDTSETLASAVAAAEAHAAEAEAKIEDPGMLLSSSSGEEERTDPAIRSARAMEAQAPQPQEVVPEVIPEIVVEIVPEIIPEIVPDLVPEIDPHVVQDLALDPVPEVVSEAIPEIVPLELPPVAEPLLELAPTDLVSGDLAPLVEPPARPLAAAAGSMEGPLPELLPELAEPPPAQGAGTFKPARPTVADTSHLSQEPDPSEFAVEPASVIDMLPTPAAEPPGRRPDLPVREAPVPAPARALRATPAGRVAIGVLKPMDRRGREARRAPPPVPVAVPEEPAPATQIAGPAAPAVVPDLQRLLAEAVQQGANDLHLHIGTPPLLRIDGELHPLNGYPAITAADNDGLLAQLQAPPLDQGGTIFSCAPSVGSGGPGRLRVTAVRQVRGPDLVIRLVPTRIPTLEELGLVGLPGLLSGLSGGLLLCSGPLGCGKTTTLAALVDFLADARQRSSHRLQRLLHIGDPIEFDLSGRPAFLAIHQRQVGKHTASTASALRAAQQGPYDLVAVSELRDLDSLLLALSLAEAGKLVVAAVVAANARRTLEQLLDLGPAARRPALRAALAQSLALIIAQRLVRRAEGRGRVLVPEVLLCTPAIAELIREEHLSELRGRMLQQRRLGMSVLEESLLNLCRSGVVSAEEARAQAQIPGLGG